MPEKSSPFSSISPQIDLTLCFRLRYTKSHAPHKTNIAAGWTFAPVHVVHSPSKHFTTEPSDLPLVF